MASASINLNYFKQGDDLAGHLDNVEGEHPSVALLAHAEQLQGVVDHLRKLAEAIMGKKVTVNADTHMIRIDGPKAVIEGLISKGLAEKE